MRTGRPVDKFGETQLRTLLELRQWAGEHQEPVLRSSEIADWLGQARQTVTRWRRELDFPRADAVVKCPRQRGKGVAYAWKPERVLAWLRRTGRLVS